LPAEIQRRVTLVQADGENADEAVDGRRFTAVLCHGVLGYYLDQLCRCAAPGGMVSIMTGNAQAGAVRPALERRWDDALASFDARTEVGVLGVQGRADTVEELSELLHSRDVEPVRWYVVSASQAWRGSSAAQDLPSVLERIERELRVPWGVAGRGRKLGPPDADYFSAADESDNARGQVGPRDRRCWCRSFSRHEWSSVLRRPV
jgi:hypothetical protein